MQKNPRKKGPRYYPWMKLSVTEAFVPLTRKRGAAKVARSYRGFYTAFRKAGGQPTRMGKTHPDTPGRGSSYMWWQRRNEFISRHMGQVNKRRESLWKSNGDPTNRHLGLIMWAYTPDPDGVLDWLRRNAPKRNPLRGRVRRNPSGWRRPEDEKLWALWGGPLSTKDEWLHHPARFELAALFDHEKEDPGYAIEEWDIVPSEVLPSLIQIARRQPVWFLLDEGPVSVFTAWFALGQPSNPTRKKMHKLVKQRNKEIKAASARGPKIMHPGKQKVVDIGNRRYTLLQTEDEYLAAADKFKNCTHWNYWYGRVRPFMKGMRVYWDKDNDHLVSFDTGDPEPHDVEVLGLAPLTDALREGDKLGEYLQQHSWPNPRLQRRSRRARRNSAVPHMVPGACRREYSFGWISPRGEFLAADPTHEDSAFRVMGSVYPKGYTEIPGYLSKGARFRPITRKEQERVEEEGWYNFFTWSLLERGWMKLSAWDEGQMYGKPPAAVLSTWAQLAAQCVVKRGFDPEKQEVLLWGRPEVEGDAPLDYIPLPELVGRYGPPGLMDQMYEQLMAKLRFELGIQLNPRGY